MRRFLLAVVTLVAICVVIPLSVLFSAWVGIGATNWSGVVLSDVRWNGGARADFPSPYAENLGKIADLNAAHPGDLAGYAYSGKLVAYAATDEGERLVRDGLKDYPYAWKLVRVPHSTSQLHARQEQISADQRGILRTTPVRVLQVGMSARGNCVELTAIRLDQDLFTRLGDFSDVACVAYEPGAQMASPDVAGQRGASAEPSRDLPGTYLVLLTGFPWHIAAVLAVTALLWLRPWRRLRPVPAPQPPAAV